MLSTVKNLFGEFMNVMINQLLQGQAVEWRALGEVLVRTKGTKITAGKMKELHKNNAPIKIFAGGKTFALVDFDDIPQKDINHKPSIIVKSRGIIEFEYYDKPFSHKNEMWAYHSQNPNINIKFIYYFLKQNEPYFQKIGSKMQMPQIATPDTDKFKIPIPPLSVQSQIVQILDTFTELNDQLRDELTAELSMRQKQYQYYRDLLLSEHELAKVGFEWKSLGKLGIINRGKRVVKSQLTTEGVYPVYQNSLQPLGYFDKSNVKANTTFMITAGAAGEIGYSNCAFWSADDCYYFDCPKDVLDDRFLYHSLKKQQNKVFSQVRKASIPRLGRNSVENIKIPIPPLSVKVKSLPFWTHLTR